MGRQMIIDHKTVQAVVFDMDGLIFDSEKVVQRSWTQASEELGLPDVGTHIYYTLGFNINRRLEYFYRTFGQDFPAEEFSALTRDKFREIEEKEGIDTKPGVEELLIYLKSQGVRIALATSSRREHAEYMLDRAGLLNYFDGSVFGDMVKNAKPDPEIYVKACEALSVSPLASIALEDSPAGIEAAYSAGMWPVMVPDLVQPSAEIRQKCGKVFDSLEGVLEWVRELK